MKIEILYPEICNLYGDSANVSFLKQQLKDAHFYETNLKEPPHFLKEDIDLVYLGSASEDHQALMINKLLPYKDQIKQKIEEGRLFLVTGDTMNIFGTEIIDENIGKIKGLGIFPFTTQRDYKHRHNSLFYGKYDQIEILGFKSSFCYSYPTITNFPFWMEVIRGEGMNKTNPMDGIHQKNFFATPVLGPILVLNPDLTKYLLHQMKANEKLIFEDAMYKAYEIRKKEYQNPKTNMIIHH